jgi:hypothetical protein
MAAEVHTGLGRFPCPFATPSGWPRRASSPRRVASATADTAQAKARPTRREIASPSPHTGNMKRWLLYRRPYRLTFAHSLVAIDAMISGWSAKRFQASQQASTMAS